MKINKISSLIVDLYWTELRPHLEYNDKVFAISNRFGIKYHLINISDLINDL
jgi:hypothetical protein